MEQKSANTKEIRSNKKRHHRASHWGTKKREPLFEERTRLARIFYYTSKSSPLYPPFRFSPEFYPTTARALLDDKAAQNDL